MAYPIRIGVQIQPQHADYAQIRATVAAAEEAGVDVAFNWDHFFPLTGDPDGKHFECWTMLAAWAEATSRSATSCGGADTPTERSISRGSRPMSAQWPSRIPHLRVNVSTSPKLCQIWACSAV